MSKFQIGDFAKSVGAMVSNLDTSEQLQYIDIDLLDENEANFYKLSDLKPLADSIAMDGLQQPLVVTPGKEGRYIVLSGHRRRAAIRLLLKEDEWTELRRVPCLVRQYKSQNLAELQLILANSTARVLTNAETMKQAERMEMLLYQLKEEGYEFPGRMRDQVAAACKVSAPKLARLKVIRKGLVPSYMELFEKDKLPEQTAYALARLPAEFQERVFKIAGEDVHGGSLERILEKYQAGWRWEPDLQCPDGKPCRRGDAFLRHDLEHSYNMCGGNKCCLTCPRAKEPYSPCDRMCSKAQAARKEKRDEEKAAADEKDRKLAKGYQKETQARASRLLRAINAAGLPDESKFAWRAYWKPLKVSDIRRWAEGVFTEEEDHWTSAELDPARLESPAALAQLLGCSTDFLLGLTEDLRPAAAENEIEQPAENEQPAADPDPEAETPFVDWMTGLPSRSCKVYGKFGPIGGDSFYSHMVVYYDNVLKLFHFGRIDKKVEYPCLGWVPLPED